MATEKPCKLLEQTSTKLTPTEKTTFLVTFQQGAKDSREIANEGPPVPHTRF